MSGPTSKDVRLTMISFRADDEVLAALERLEKAVGHDIVTQRRRSIAIRRALLEADERLRASKRKGAG